LPAATAAIVRAPGPPVMRAAYGRTGTAPFTRSG
jgi:hypothetical protein